MDFLSWFSPYSIRQTIELSPTRSFSQTNVLKVCLHVTEMNPKWILPQWFPQLIYDMKHINYVHSWWVSHDELMLQSQTMFKGPKGTKDTKDIWLSLHKNMESWIFDSIIFLYTTNNISIFFFTVRQCKIAYKLIFPSLQP